MRTNNMNCILQNRFDCYTFSCAIDMLTECIEYTKRNNEDETSVKTRFRLRDDSIIFMHLKSVIKVCDISQT
jgi:hypothetical protein